MVRLKIAAMEASRAPIPAADPDPAVCYTMLTLTSGLETRSPRTLSFQLHGLVPPEDKTF
jgi:hypothetical protein